MTYREAMRKAKVEFLTDLMGQARGNVAEAARLAEMNRSELHRKLTKFGIREVLSHGNEQWRSLAS